MSASSLASEIGQLHELFKLGALTEEEFNAAKQATIRSFMSKASVSEAAPPPALPQGSPSPPAREETARSRHQSDESRSGDSAPPAASALTNERQQEQQQQQQEHHQTVCASLSATSERTSAPASLPPLPRSREEWQQLWDDSPIRAPAPSPPQQQQQHESTPSLTAPPSTPFSLVDAVDLRVQALRCADRLLRNVEMQPAEAKYRRIRASNRVVSQELLAVEASAALLQFAGFTREEDAAATATVGDFSSSPSSFSSSPLPSAVVWVQRDEPAEASRRAARARRVLGHLMEYFGMQQSRRLAVQQLWRSVALEVRLERAARDAVSAGGFVGITAAVPKRGATSEDTSNLANEEQESEASPGQHPFLQYLVECYTVDEAGDGLYSSLQHLSTLHALYSSLLAGTAPPFRPLRSSVSPSQFSLLTTEEVYGAVVQQRGAVELLLYGCNARLHPAPAAFQRAQLPLAAAAHAPASCEETGEKETQGVVCPSYFVDLAPEDERTDGPLHYAQCVELILWLRTQVVASQQQRTRAAREAAERSMRLELKRERQRQQLEQGRGGRGEVEPESQSLPRRPRLHPTRQRKGGASSSSSSLSSEEGSGDAQAASAQQGGTRRSSEGSGRNRIPIAEALAILMGKKSPPRQRQPPTASSSPSS